MTSGTLAAGAIRSRTVDVNGVGLHCDELGAGPPILCVHGAGSSAQLWAPALPVLAGAGRAIAYDRRAYGRNERRDPVAPMSVRMHTEDAAALLEALDATPAVVIGRSYGGEVAIDLALSHPQHVRALVLLEGVPESFDPGAEEWLRELVDRTLAAEGGGPGAVARTLLGSVLGPDGWEGLPEPVRSVFIGNEPAILAEFKGEYLLDIEPEALSAIDKPTLIVTAAESPPAFARANRRAAEAMPAARTAVVEGSHFVDPASPVVLSFLEEVLSQDRSPEAPAP